MMNVETGCEWVLTVSCVTGEKVFLHVDDCTCQTELCPWVPHVEITDWQALRSHTGFLVVGHTKPSDWCLHSSSSSTGGPVEGNH